MPFASAILYSPFDELDDHFTNAHRFGRPRKPELLLLRPNQRALLLLCPLLPPSPTYGSSKSSKSRQLPAEVWQRVLSFAMRDEDDVGGGSVELGNVRLLLVCKSFQNLATPLLYTSVRLYTLRALELFAATLTTADAKWDSIRRIPHSTPGRWVQRVSLAHLKSCSPLAIDSILVRVIPVMPFLTSLELDGRYVMSWRVAGVVPKGLRVLKGMRVREEVRFEGVKGGDDDDALTGLVRTLKMLEELGVQGPGLDLDEDEEQAFEDEPEEEVHDTRTKVILPRLAKLTLLDCPYTPVYRMLGKASLPALEDLTITTTPTAQIAQPDPIPGQPAPPAEAPTFVQPTPTSMFLMQHGTTLQKLSLLPTQQWPPAPAPAPEDILVQCPNLQKLVLSMPLPARLFPAEPTKPRNAAPVSPLLARLALSPDPSITRVPTPPPREIGLDAPSYPLRTITVPVPTQAFLSCLTGSGGQLRNLKEVRFSSARWLRRGMGRHAQGAGVNGEMMRWRRELGRAKIRVVDSEGKEEVEELYAPARPLVGLGLVGMKREGVRKGQKEEVQGRRWSG